MISFKGFSGFIKRINDLMQGQDESTSGCYKVMEVENEEGSIVNFIVAPTTYFVNGEVVAIGDRVTGYYDGNAPVPLIYPPQFRALIMVKEDQDENVKVDYFDEELISSDGMLKLKISRDTELLLPNNQPFNRNPADRNLIVIYGPSTKSIPAQTTPSTIIVLC